MNLDMDTTSLNVIDSAIWLSDRQKLTLKELATKLPSDKTAALIEHVRLLSQQSEQKKKSVFANLHFKITKSLSKFKVTVSKLRKSIWKKSEEREHVNAIEYANNLLNQL